MVNPIAALLQQRGSLSTTAFAPNSRYHGTPTVVMDPGPRGEPVVYLARRFVPQPDRFADLGEHLVVDGDRLDNIAARHLGDPEMFWQVCDANAAMRPDELTETPGRRLRVTLPRDVPGTDMPATRMA